MGDNDRTTEQGDKIPRRYPPGTGLTASAPSARSSRLQVAKSRSALVRHGLLRRTPLLALPPPLPPPPRTLPRTNTAAAAAGGEVGKLCRHSRRRRGSFFSIIARVLFDLVGSLHLLPYVDMIPPRRLPTTSPKRKVKHLGVLCRWQKGTIYATNLIMSNTVDKLNKSKSSGLVNVFTLVLPLVCWGCCCCCLFLWQWTMVS